MAAGKVVCFGYSVRSQICRRQLAARSGCTQPGPTKALSITLPKPSAATSFLVFMAVGCERDAPRLLKQSIAIASGHYFAGRLGVMPAITAKTMLTARRTSLISKSVRTSMVMHRRQEWLTPPIEARPGYSWKAAGRGSRERALTAGP